MAGGAAVLISVTGAVAGAAARAAAGQETREAGSMRDVAMIGDEPIVIHAYRPRACPERALLFVFPGYERNAGEYLRRARRVARSHGLTVFAPELDRERFPRARYQRAGVSAAAAEVDAERCMGLFVRRLVAWGRERQGRPDAPYLLFGHSAGAQMLVRVAAYCPLEAPARIVVANPSAYVAASLIDPRPYGFAGRGDLSAREDQLRAYVAQPLSIYLGTDDTGTELLDDSLHAQRQGPNRLERGRAVFDQAHRLAATRGWSFGWRLVLAPGVGHSSRGMLRAPQLDQAIAIGAHPAPSIG